MRIDKNNYEAYFIDYYEGNLSKEVGEELFEFLAQHPDLREEFLAFEALSDTQDDKKFQLKNSLKKEVSDLGRVTSENIDEYCVAFLEDDLSNRDKDRFIDQVYGNKQFERTFRLYQHTKLKPDESRIFTLKSEIKRFTLNRKVILRMSSIAAAAAVLVGLVLRYESTEKLPGSIEPPIEIVQTHEPLEPIQRPEIKKLQPLIIPTERLVGMNNTASMHAKEPQKTSQLAVADSAKGSIRIAMETIDRKIPEKIENPYSTEVFTNENSIPVIQLAELTRHTAETKSESEPEAIKTGNEIGQNRFNLMTLAEVGIRMISKLNERNIEVKPHYDETGDLKSVTLITNRRTITTPAI